MTSILKPILESLAAQGRADPSRLVSEMGATSSSAPGDPLRWTVRGWPSFEGEQAVGEHDVRGYLGLRDMPRPSDTGLSMRVDVRAAPGQDPERVKEMLAAAERASGVLGMLRAAVPVALTMESR